MEVVTVVLDTPKLWTALSSAALPWGRPPVGGVRPGALEDVEYQDLRLESNHVLNLVYWNQRLTSAHLEVASTDDFSDAYGDPEVDVDELLEERMHDIDEFFEEMRAEASHVFGEPDLAWTLDERPLEASDAFCLARWSRSNATITLGGDHEGARAPVRLLLLLAPPS